MARRRLLLAVQGRIRRQAYRASASRKGNAARPARGRREEPPLEFRAWAPDAKLVPGIWNIPVPADGAVIEPDALLVPLVGFDSEGYRLGYGGGYYDRTLASRRRKPLTIGVGFELSELPTIHPQPHDIPMDAIVTEARFE